ncbi:hypothetical protein [Allostreptomyces psammosilenae]|uniref:Uncharacterized protein n=1 Tax=Allostreptomyces psammosilenae TaxID=1892865 RepID=A0A852ZQ30_9ACTN|nr:hypothetical protein [Allostreptomyces psammosilenae]NYI03370.1 hypothetical protein [Allostreptomyces psammosilenae]
MTRRATSRPAATAAPAPETAAPGTGAGATPGRATGGRAGTLLAAVGAARTAWAALTRRPPGEAVHWERTNYSGRVLTLLEGPSAALATGAAIATAPGLPGRVRAAGVLATTVAGALGTYDDLAGTGARRGFRQHLGALAKGEVTSGAVKLFGIGAAGLAAGALLKERPVDKLLAGVVIGGTANLINLLDLRPGRAGKAVLLSGVPTVLRGGVGGTVAAAPVGAAAALIGEDLGERAMLGDAGANALGAALGVASVANSSRAGLLVRAGVLVALTAASERISFTKVIASVPALRAVDEFGRRPQPPADAPTSAPARAGAEADAEQDALPDAVQPAAPAAGPETEADLAPALGAGTGAAGFAAEFEAGLDTEPEAGGAGTR